MKVSEAINELQSNIDLPFGFTVSDEVSEIAIQALQEVQQYRAIGTVEELQDLKEKNEPKKIIQTVENGRMKRIFSCCGTDCTQMTSWMIPKFCPHCGSKTET